MKITLKPFQPGKELGKVMKIWLSSNEDAHDFLPEGYWKSHEAEVAEILPQAQVEVAFIDGSLIGFAGIEDGYLAGIFVEQSHRSHGVGKALLDWAKTEYPALSLDVYDQNRKALTFYQREGFEIVSSQTEEHGLIEHRMEWKNDTF